MQSTTASKPSRSDKVPTNASPAWATAWVLSKVTASALGQ